MKIIHLSDGAECLVDDEDYEALAARRWFPNKARQTTANTYAYTKIMRKSVSMHRLLLAAGTGQEVDHKNGNGLDNTRENLRLCTRSENCANITRSGGASGYIGVFKWRQRWQASIGSTRSKRIFIGTFDDPVTAAKARDAAALAHYGEFARLNFPVTA